ncbi:MAG TPA: hypothetical protein VGI35_03040, partial [Steroidobacteraceae bacterium]
MAAPASRARDTHLPLIVVLGALGAALLWFVAKKIHYLTDFSPASYAPYFRVGTLHHVLGRVYAAVMTTGMALYFMCRNPRRPT